MAGKEKLLNQWYYAESCCTVVEGRDKDRPLTLHFYKMMDTATKKYSLAIEINDLRKSENTFVLVGLRNISRELINLRDYGLMLQEYEVVEIVSLIEQNFETIDEGKSFNSEEIESTIFDKALKVIALYILEEDIKPTKIDKIEEQLYLIHWKDFEDIFSDGEFRKMNIADFRQELRDKGYTHCNAGRTRYSVKDKESQKPITYIAFWADRMDEIQTQAIKGLDSK